MRLITVIAMLAGFVGAPPRGAPGYRILVASESGDIVTELTWDGTALSVAKVVPVGIMPADIDGPHNVTAAPDGSAWYVTIAHGTPYGSLWKMSAGTDSLLGRAPLEMFPTTIALTPDGALAFVAGNTGNSLQVIDAASLALVREVPVGTGAYNVEPSADGRWIIVTNKKAQSVSLVDAQSLTEVAKIPTSKPLPHGVAYSPDGRWAFVSQESVGIDPGAVDVIDLTTRARVASIPVPRQPTGIPLLPTP